MARRRIHIRLSTLWVLAGAFSGVLGVSRPRYGFEAAVLFARDAGCADSSYSACNKNGLPSNFCCPAGNSCYVFNENQSVICCPDGKDCSSISTISCDITQQNVTAHPTSPLFTTQLNAKMQSCGNACCPNGMTCQGGNQCVLSSSSSASSAAASSTTSVASTAASPAEPTSQAPASAAASTTASSSPSPSSTSSSQGAATSTHCNQFPLTGVLVGFFSGLTLGIILTVLLICCFGRSNKDSSQKRKDRPHSDFSSVTATVSDPIYQPGASERADFLRRDSRSKYKYASSTSTSSRVRSFFTRTPTMKHSRNSDSATGEATAGNGERGPGGVFRSVTGRSKRSNHSGVSSLTAPKTPKTPSTLKKEPSMESIKIYSPPNIAGLHPPVVPGSEDRMTTFKDMMAQAGFKEGDPYLGSPGRVDPRSRRIGEV